jgi:hypothetical protein
MSKKFAYVSFACVAAGLVWLGMSASKAEAFPPFKSAFLKEYTKPDSTDEKDVAFKAAAEKAGCDICHAGKDKKKRNAYGKALEQYLKPNMKNAPDKIKEGLESGAKEHSDPSDEKSPTFGEKIAAGKLPAGK